MHATGTSFIAAGNRSHVVNSSLGSNSMSWEAALTRERQRVRMEASPPGPCRMACATLDIAWRTSQRPNQTAARYWLVLLTFPVPDYRAQDEHRAHPSSFASGSIPHHGSVRCSGTCTNMRQPQTPLLAAGTLCGSSILWR